MHRHTQRAAKLGKVLENKNSEELLGTGQFSLEKRRLRGELIAFYDDLKGGCSKATGVFPQVKSNRT